jgi:hypothetical protein
METIADEPSRFSQGYPWCEIRSGGAIGTPAFSK